MRQKIEYFDIALSVINLIVLTLTAFLININILLLLLSLISLGILGGISIITFIRKNPYYISSCYALVILGLIFSIVLLFYPDLFDYSFYFIITLLLNIFAIGSSVKGSASSQSKFATITGVKTIIEPGKTRPTYIQNRHESLESDKINEKQIDSKRDSLQINYKFKLIISLTILFAAIYLATIIISWII